MRLGLPNPKSNPKGFTRTQTHALTRTPATPCRCALQRAVTDDPPDLEPSLVLYG